jgi:hypothetical protein
MELRMSGWAGAVQGACHHACFGFRSERSYLLFSFIMMVKKKSVLLGKGAYYQLVYRILKQAGGALRWLRAFFSFFKSFFNLYLL